MSHITRGLAVAVVLSITALSCGTAPTTVVDQGGVDQTPTATDPVATVEAPVSTVEATVATAPVPTTSGPPPETSVDTESQGMVRAADVLPAEILAIADRGRTDGFRGPALIPTRVPPWSIETIGWGDEVSLGFHFDADPNPNTPGNELVLDNNAVNDGVPSNDDPNGRPLQLGNGVTLRVSGPLHVCAPEAPPDGDSAAETSLGFLWRNRHVGLNRYPNVPCSEIAEFAEFLLGLAACNVSAVEVRCFRPNPDGVQVAQVVELLR